MLDESDIAVLIVFKTENSADRKCRVFPITLWCCRARQKCSQNESATQPQLFRRCGIDLWSHSDKMLVRLQCYFPTFSVLASLGFTSISLSAVLLQVASVRGVRRWRSTSAIMWGAISTSILQHLQNVYKSWLKTFNDFRHTKNSHVARCFQTPPNRPF